jgi:tripartite-type tricarboxylate transporter receptor subunit TctC
VSIGNAGIGTIPHVAAAALGERTGTSYVHVPYQGSAPAITGLLLGDVQATTVAVESAKLRTLAVMADKRVAGLEAPTLKERGYPLEFSVWRGIGMPKGAPKEAMAAWSAAARKLAADPAFQATIAKQSLTSPLPIPPSSRQRLRGRTKRSRPWFPNWASSHRAPSRAGWHGRYFRPT